MPRYPVPQLKGYGDAIQANSSFINAFRNLGNQSQDVLKLEEQKRKNEWEKTFKQNQLDNQMQYNNKQNEIKLGELNFKKQQDEAKKQANTEALKFVNPRLYSDIGAKFGDMPTVENANKMNDITGNIDLSKVKPTKPNYKLEKTNQGFVMFDTSNPSAEPIKVAGNYKPYTKPTSSGSGPTRKTTDQLNWLLYNSSRKAKGLEPIGYDDFYNQKMNTKTMGVGLRDANTVNQETDRVSKILGITPYQLSSYNFNKLGPQQRYEMDNLILMREQGLKSKIPDKMREQLNDLSSVVYSANEISKNLNSKDTGMIDATFNRINQYLGIGDVSELAKRTLTQANYQLYSNFMLKSMSGLAVTAAEEGRFTKAFGSLMLNDLSTAVKIKTNMENLAFRLENMKKSYDPIAFNYRYGDLLRGVNNAVNKMGTVLNKSNKQDTFVNANGDTYNQTQKTIVKTLKNKNTGQIMNVYSDGSTSYE